jgi:hypothetical protein
VIALDSPQLIEAVRIWTGWKQLSWPQRDDERLVERFGAVMAAELLAIIRALEADFYASTAAHTAGDIREVGRLASTHFRQLHPTIADEIVAAFRWCYTFDWK